MGVVGDSSTLSHAIFSRPIQNEEQVGEMLSKYRLWVLFIFFCGTSCVIIILSYVNQAVSITRIRLEPNRTLQRDETLSVGAIPRVPTNLLSSGTQYLTYQPPGNGWNNQRMVIETALVLARLLNRTLIVHPMSSHLKGELMEASLPPTARFGYITYNKMEPIHLLPLSNFLDLELLSQVVPLVEVNTTHREFLDTYKHLRWHRICHESVYGYWIDRRTVDVEEARLVAAQTFLPNEVGRGKCLVEEEESKHLRGPIVKYVSDLANDVSDILYFEQGTLFTAEIRFTQLKAALLAQRWVLDHMRYGRHVYDLAARVAAQLGAYNAVHIRRFNHVDRQLPAGYWIVEMMNLDFTFDVPVYVATDERNKEWFGPIRDAGYKLYFASNFSEILDFSHYSRHVRRDVLGIHEQIICEKSVKFLGSIRSTFSGYILRLRGELEKKDNLYHDTLHTTWIKHTAG